MAILENYQVFNLKLLKVMLFSRNFWILFLLYEEFEKKCTLLYFSIVIVLKTISSRTNKKNKKL